MASAAAAKKCPRPSQRWSSAASDQPKVRLMDQGGGLEGVLGGLAGHARGGELAQLVVDEREQVGGGLAVTGRRGVQESRHVGHSASVTDVGGASEGKPAAEPPSVLSPDAYVPEGGRTLPQTRRYQVVPVAADVVLLPLGEALEAVDL